MTHPIQTQPLPTYASQLPEGIIAPQLPNPPAPQFQLDPTNPLVWVLLLTALLGNTDEVIKAIADLLKAIATLKNGKTQNKSDKDSDEDDRNA